MEQKAIHTIVAWNSELSFQSKEFIKDKIKDPGNSRDLTKYFHNKNTMI